MTRPPSRRATEQEPGRGRRAGDGRRRGAGAQHAPADGGAPGRGAGARRGRGRGEIEGELDELVEVAAQRDEYLALAQRTQADFENYRKRVARESRWRRSAAWPSSPRSCCPRSTTSTARSEAAADRGPAAEGVRLVRSELARRSRGSAIESFAPRASRSTPPARGDGPAAGGGRRERHASPRSTSPATAWASTSSARRASWWPRRP